MIIKSRMFWIATFVFLVVAVGTVGIFYPSQLVTYKENKAKADDLDSQIQTQQGYATLITNLKNNQKDVQTLFEKANLALPAKKEPEILMLELDGLISSLGINATATVPFSGGAATTTTTTATPTPTPAAGEVKPGSAGQAATPTPTTTGTVDGTIAFTIKGTMSYDQLNKLLVALKASTPWNKVTSIDLTSADGGLTATLNVESYYKKAPTIFTGKDADFLAKAKTLFDQVNTYTTIPNSATEGNYGRGNPFQPL